MPQGPNRRKRTPPEKPANKPADKKKKAKATPVKKRTSPKKKDGKNKNEKELEETLLKWNLEEKPFMVMCGRDHKTNADVGDHGEKTVEFRRKKDWVESRLFDLTLEDKKEKKDKKEKAKCERGISLRVPKLTDLSPKFKKIRAEKMKTTGMTRRQAEKEFDHEQKELKKQLESYKESKKSKEEISEVKRQIIPKRIKNPELTKYLKQLNKLDDDERQEREEKIFNKRMKDYNKKFTHVQLDLGYKNEDERAQFKTTFKGIVKLKKLPKKKYSNGLQPGQCVDEGDDDKNDKLQKLVDEVTTWPYYKIKLGPKTWQNDNAKALFNKKVLAKKEKEEAKKKENAKKKKEKQAAKSKPKTKVAKHKVQKLARKKKKKAPKKNQKKKLPAEQKRKLERKLQVLRQLCEKFDLVQVEDDGTNGVWKYCRFWNRGDNTKEPPYLKSSFNKHEKDILTDEKLSPGKEKSTSFLKKKIREEHPGLKKVRVQN